MLSHGCAPLHQLDAAEDGAAVLMHLPSLQQKTHRALGRGFRDRVPLRGGTQGRRGCSTSCPRLCLRARAQPKQTYSYLIPPLLKK